MTASPAAHTSSHLLSQEWMINIKMKISRNPNIFSSQTKINHIRTLKNKPFDDQMKAKFEEVKILIFKVMTFEIKV